jgi:hypothetical protein
MPKAKHVEEAKEPEAPVTETIKEKVTSALRGTCGHVNKQHYNTKGKLEDLACDLEPKHAGDHHAKYQKNVPEPVTDEKGRVTNVNYHEEEADAYWTNAAGKPAKDISEGTVPQLSLMQKDLLAQLMARNPDMTVEVALEKVKTDPRWNASTALS